MKPLKGPKDKQPDSLQIRKLNWLLEKFLKKKLSAEDLIKSPEEIQTLNRGIRNSLGEPAENYGVFLTEFLDQAYSNWPTYKEYRELVDLYDDFIEGYETGLDWKDWADEEKISIKIQTPLRMAKMFTKKTIRSLENANTSIKMNSDPKLQHKYDALNERLNTIERTEDDVSQWQMFSELDRFSRLEKLNKKDDQEDFLRKCNEADSELNNRIKDLLEKTVNLSREMARGEIDEVVDKILHSIFCEFGEINDNELKKMTGVLGTILAKYYLDDSENELGVLEQFFTQSIKSTYIRSLITLKLVIDIHTLLTPIWYSLTTSLKNFRKNPAHYRQNEYNIIYNYNGKFDFNSEKIHVIDETQIHMKKFLSLMDGLPLDRISNCKGCSHWFIKTKTNKDYCSGNCASRTRQQRYREKHRDEYNKKQRELMSKKSQVK